MRGDFSHLGRNKALHFSNICLSWDTWAGGWLCLSSFPISQSPHPFTSLLASFHICHLSKSYPSQMNSPHLFRKGRKVRQVTAQVKSSAPENSHNSPTEIPHHLWGPLQCPCPALRKQFFTWGKTVMGRMHSSGWNEPWGIATSNWFTPAWLKHFTVCGFHSSKLLLNKR